MLRVSRKNIIAHKNRPKRRLAFSLESSDFRRQWSQRDESVRLRVVPRANSHTVHRVYTHYSAVWRGGDGSQGDVHRRRETPYSLLGQGVTAHSSRGRRTCPGPGHAPATRPRTQSQAPATTPPSAHPIAIGIARSPVRALSRESCRSCGHCCGAGTAWLATTLLQAPVSLHAVRSGRRRGGAGARMC